MYYNDHSPPHFHAYYGAHEMLVQIHSGQILSGDMPRRARALTLEWLSLHRNELLQNWDLAQARKPLKRIEPLE